MKKRIAALLLSTVMAFSLTACGNSAKTEKADNKETKQTTEAVEDMSFDEMVDAAKGTTVTFYGWGGDDSLNDWLDNYYAPRLKEKYDITLERVPMDIDAILSQLSGEISTDKKSSSKEEPFCIIFYKIVYAVGFAAFGSLSMMSCIKLSVHGRASITAPSPTTASLASSVGANAPPRTSPTSAYL